MAVMLLYFLPLIPSQNSLSESSDSMPSIEISLEGACYFFIRKKAMPFFLKLR